MLSVPERGDFDRFLNGEVFYSPEPRRLDTLPADIIRDLKSWAIERTYGSCGDTDVWYSRHPALRTAATIVSFYGNDVVPEMRFGNFSERGQYYEPPFHIDGYEHSYESTICVVGQPTKVLVGNVVRVIDGSSRVMPADRDCREYDLLEGTIYRFPPTSAHAEPRATAMGRMRYFWRVSQRV